jgi:hypothetical protein
LKQFSTVKEKTIASLLIIILFIIINNNNTPLKNSLQKLYLPIHILRHDVLDAISHRLSREERVSFGFLPPPRREAGPQAACEGGVVTLWLPTAIP